MRKRIYIKTRRNPRKWKETLFLYKTSITLKARQQLLLAVYPIYLRESRPLENKRERERSGVSMSSHCRNYYVPSHCLSSNTLLCNGSNFLWISHFSARFYRRAGYTIVAGLVDRSLSLSWTRINSLSYKYIPKFSLCHQEYGYKQWDPSHIQQLHRYNIMRIYICIHV